MISIPSPAHVLLGTDAAAHVWTVNPAGSGQVSIVWAIVQGDEILFGTDAGSRKARNLEHNPRVILSVEDTERSSRVFQRRLVIHGGATIEPGSDPAPMDRLAQKHAGLDRHPLAMRDLPTSVMVMVAVERIGGVGPWMEPVGSPNGPGSARG